MKGQKTFSEGMNLTDEQRAWYLRWLYAKPQDDTTLELERFRFLRGFRVSTAFELLTELEAWPTNAAEPGELVMQRWFRLFYMKMQVGGSAHNNC
jgi:hypothetical protein